MAGLLSFLSDITIKKPELRGPLQGLLGKSDYEVSTYRYPEDLAAADKGHYILININEQRLTSYGDGDKKSVGVPTAIQNQNELRSYAAGSSNQLKTIGGFLKEGGSFGAFVSSTIGLTGAAQSLGKTLKTTTAGATAVGVTTGTMEAIFSQDGIIDRLQNGSVRAEKRTKDVIALYMPDTVVFDQAQGYGGDVGAGGGLPAAAAALGGSIVDLYQNKNLSNEQKGNQFGRNVTPFAFSALAKEAGGFGQIAFQQVFGVVQNPMLEVLYSSPSFRTFRFDFQFYPRSQKESITVQEIIKKLRFHQAPEVAQGGTGGFFLVPPSEFDISFYYNGTENPNIPKVSTCVLQNLTIDYAPGGFTSYEVPGQGAALGGTGMPVSIRVSLQFKETEIITKTSIDPKYNEGRRNANASEAAAAAINQEANRLQKEFGSSLS
jgi:hypothetical protein